MTVASILVGNQAWIWPMVGLLVLSALALGWAYRRLTATTRVRATAIALKATGLAILAACLIEPLWSGVRARPGANDFAVVVDHSQSLRIRDSGASQTRGERLREILGDEETPWQVRLSQDFNVRRYLADARLRGVPDFSQLTFDGDATSLATALTTLEQRFEGRPLACVLLFTDGNATDVEEGAFDLENLPPVYPVLIGSNERVQDIAIRDVSVSQTAFEDAPVSIRADIAADGYAGLKIVTRLLNPRGEAVEEHVQTALEENERFAARFQIRPPQSGVMFYRLQVAPEGELDAFENPDVSSEATLANNTRFIKVDRGTGPQRVLYVSGRPNWELKFLRRALDEDEQVELTALVRIADREPKFEWRGRQGESSNPLFRGFKKEGDEETERYDEAVLVRLNVRDESELQSGFPKTPEELFEFDALILDDLEAEFFTHDQLALIERFVSERGGGLLMLGGQESFQQGNYRRTPIEDLLPVYLDRGGIRRPRAPYRLTLTRDGWLQPWVRLRRTEQEEQQRLAEMPEFRTLNAVGNVKPGTMVLAAVTDPRGEQHPALIVHRYGRGRSAALTVGDLWRWQMRRSSEENDLAKAWRQTLRWLVADVPGRVDLQVEPRPEIAASAMRIQARIRNEAYRPQENAAVTVRIQPPVGDDVVLQAEPSLEEAGLFEVDYVPRQPGVYRAVVEANDGRGEAIGSRETGWASDPAAKEFRSIVPNRALMEQLAEQTGGEVIDGAQLNAFVQSLPSRKAPITEPYTLPLWHQSWVFLLALGCFAGEWGLRRWKGLP